MLILLHHYDIQTIHVICSLEREEAEDLIKRHGGRVTSAVSKKTVINILKIFILDFVYDVISYNYLDFAVEFSFS